MMVTWVEMVEVERSYRILGITLKKNQQEMAKALDLVLKGKKCVKNDHGGFGLETCEKILLLFSISETLREEQVLR